MPHSPTPERCPRCDRAECGTMRRHPSEWSAAVTAAWNVAARDCENAAMQRLVDALKERGNV
jgi:hypothetical protein